MSARPALSLIEQSVLRRMRAMRVPVGARVLDAPCGSGALVHALMQSGYDAFGTDVVPAAAGLLGERFLRGDLGGGIQAADASFDLVLSVEGVEHLENPHAFLGEIHRVLKPGGLCIVTTPNIVSIRSRLRFFGSSFYNQDPRPLNESARHPLHHISLKTFAELRYALETSGLAVAAVSHTHIKPISRVYAIFYPWIALYTRMAFRKEKDAAQRARNEDIYRALLSPSLLFGENVMIVAENTRQHGDR
ncbi:MAG TPA: class I SAM-dependent methyltransferase [Vicinamibacterales bacterium]|nr:class I SAM-dependent methyltransferase [Vicinamibacterales bacterium]